MATIKDVAREANVSVATVSRVCNDIPGVKDATRRRVQSIAARLGYSPNGAARSLITSRTNTLGVLLPDLYGEFFSEVIRGIDQTARRHGYHLLVSSSHSDKDEIEAALRSMRGRVDGLIVMSPDMDAQVAVKNLPARFPVVLLNCASDDGTLDSLTIENYEGAYALVRHLVGLGHRRIAMIKGSERNHDAAERLRGYRAALRAARLKPARSWEVPGDFSEASGYRAALELLRRTPRPTAIFAANDSMAIGALSALRELGIAVPGEVAVAGFDDIPLARYMNPPLSSVHVDISVLGARATDRLLEVVRGGGGGAQRHDTLPTRLVIRSSCGGQPASDSPIRESPPRVPARPGSRRSPPLPPLPPDPSRRRRSR
ncbi:MAG: LacI family DNA-binding transcriptional regulator [Gemmatimonadaceae bacterium]